MSKEMPARFPFSGSGNKTVNLPEVADYFVLFNYGSVPLTFTLSQRFRTVFSMTLGPGDVFEEQVDPFHIVQITATSTYGGWIKQSDSLFTLNPEFLYR